MIVIFILFQWSGDGFSYCAYSLAPKPLLVNRKVRFIFMRGAIAHIGDSVRPLNNCQVSYG